MNVANWYAVAKALHLIGMVSWMAGLFYLVRIMVNHAVARDQPEPDRSILMKQYSLMEWRVYRAIIVVATVITWTFGTLMLFLQPAWLAQPWIWVKLGLVVFLTYYTWYCRGQIRHQENGTSPKSHVFYRALNEVPTLVLVMAIFLAVFKSGINWLYLILGMTIFTALIARGISRMKQ